MESNYETLRLNENIAVAAYHGGRFYPASCQSNSQSQASKGGAPVIDYFDYVNPSEAEEKNEEKEEKEERMSLCRSWADEVEQEMNEAEYVDKGTKDAIENYIENSTVKLDCITDQKATEHHAKMVNQKEKNNNQRVVPANVSSQEVVGKKKKKKSEKCTADTKENQITQDKSKADLGKTAEGKSRAAIKNNTSKDSAAEVTKNYTGKHKDKSEPENGNDKVQSVESKNKSNKTKEISNKMEDVKNKGLTLKEGADINTEDKEVIETVQTSISPGLQTINRAEIRTALQVDTSYTAGVSSDSNCSQYSVGSWTSEHDTSSSLDPSPNPWGSYIDSGVSFGTSTGIYSDTSDISGEDCGMYETSHQTHSDFRSIYNGKSVQIFPRFPCGTKLCYNVDNCSSSEIDGAIHNENGAFHMDNIAVYKDSIGVPVVHYDSYGDYQDHLADDSREITCDYCGCCACTMYETCPRERLCPGDVFYYSSNSMVLCVRQSKLPVQDIMESQVSKSV